MHIIFVSIKILEITNFLTFNFFAMLKLQKGVPLHTHTRRLAGGAVVIHAAQTSLVSRIPLT